MNTIKSLNSQYEQVKETLKLLRLTENNITNEQHNRQLSQEEIAARSLTHIADLVSKTDCSDFAFLGDTFLAGNQYVKCCDAIEEYRKKILHDPKDKRAIQTAVKIIKDERTNFDSIKASFEQKYNYLIDSADVLNEAMSDSVERALSATKDNTERLLQEAREIAEREYTVELKMNDPLQKGTELPEDFLIARRAENSVKETILKSPHLHCVGTEWPI